MSDSRDLIRAAVFAADAHRNQQRKGWKKTPYINHPLLEETFGTPITSLVREVSDNKALPKAERKRLQVEHAATRSPGAKQVKIADKICNVRDVAYDPPSVWSRERRQEYLDWAEEVVSACRGANERLDALFEVVIADARKTISQ